MLTSCSMHGQQQVQLRDSNPEDLRYIGAVPTGGGTDEGSVQGTTHCSGTTLPTDINQQSG